MRNTFFSLLGLLAAVVLFGAFGGINSAEAGKCGQKTRSYDCGEYDANAKFKGGGYNPQMVMKTICIPDDVWRAMLVNGRGNWTLNFAYPKRRLNEVIQNVTSQCITRLMPAGYLAAAYIRCTYYTGPMAANIGNGGKSTMVRRPDMES